MDRVSGTGGWTTSKIKYATRILADLDTRELMSPHWDEVALLLDRIATAVAADDPAAFSAAVTELEISSGARVLRIGGVLPSGIPEPVLERRNALVHALPEAPSESPPARPSLADEDDRDHR